MQLSGWSRLTHLNGYITETEVDTSRRERDGSRPLLSQADDGRELAAKLYHSVLIGCRQDGSNRDDILRAFADLDRDLAMNLARDLGIDFPKLKPPKKGDDIDLNKPLFDRVSDDDGTLERLLRLEASGEDYDVGVLIHGPDVASTEAVTAKASDGT